MHRRLLGLMLGLVLVPLSSAACRRSPADARPGTIPIFREIFIVGDTVRLGEVFRGAGSLRRAPGDTVVALRRGTFSGPAAIAVYLTRGDTVKALSFEFAPGARYEAMVADYTQSLGRPLRRVRVPEPKNGPSDITTWEDARTSLQLMRGDVAGTSRVASALFDRRLSGR